jgi:hypothetical protein
MARGPRLVQRLAPGPRACSDLLKARAIHRSGSGVGAEQCQVEPWPRDQPNVGSIFLTPAQLEQVTGLLDRDGFPPRPPLAVVFGQREVIDVNLVPVLGQRMVGSGVHCDGFVALCLARDFR